MDAKPYDWMPEAQAIAAQCWCDEKTSGIEMNVDLAEAFARRIAAWMQTGAAHATNEEFWRNETATLRAKVSRLETIDLDLQMANQKLAAAESKVEELTQEMGDLRAFKHAHARMPKSELRKDAERYRFIRNDYDERLHTLMYFDPCDDSTFLISGEQLDAAIDAAMKEAQS
jgi:hypothetical protein